MHDRAAFPPTRRARSAAWAGVLSVAVVALFAVPILARLSAPDVSSDILNQARLAAGMVKDGGGLAYSVWYLLVYALSGGAGASDHALRIVAFGIVVLAVVARTLVAYGFALARLRRPWSSALVAIVAGLAILLLFGYVLIWGCACLGASSEDAESVTNLGLITLFPLAIISNALVPTSHMPAVIRFIAVWNPVSVATTAVRDLWNSPSPPAGIHALPVQHPVPAALIWCASLLAIFVPLAIYLYRKRTTT